MRKKIEFEIGQKVAGVEILDIKTGELCHQGTKYLVRYDCCGCQRWVGHKCLLLRIRKGITRCKACHDKDFLEKSRVNPPRKKKEQSYILGWGMTLGKMGHRHSGYELSNR